MPGAEPVLIAALSGRALARSARAAGIAPVVLDAFGDLDTRAAAEGWARVPVDRRWRFRREALLAAAGLLAPPPCPLVWGSGFEGDVGLLEELAAGRPVWGTPPAAVRAAKDPLRFASAAARLRVPHPRTRATPPAVPFGWLRKRAGAAGGGHVRPATVARRPEGRGSYYWQRLAPGRPVSTLVVGDGAGARALGFSEQWATPRGGRRRFRFAGAAAPAALQPETAATLADLATRVAAAHGLVGIGSVDALVAADGGVTAVLELNPRPGASLDAHERALGLNLFRVHRDAAVLGRLPEAAPVPVGAAGSAIVWAPPRGLRVPPGFGWPPWAADRAPGGTAIPPGGPVCTVQADGGDAAEVRAALAGRERDLLGLLLPGVRPAAGRRSSAGRPSPGAPRASAPPGTGP